MNNTEFEKLDKDLKIKRCKIAALDLNSIGQTTCTEIASIAKLALAWLEHPAAYSHVEVIAGALQAILEKAQVTVDHLDGIAEGVGCEWEDIGRVRRHEALTKARQLGGIA